MPSKASWGTSTGDSEHEAVWIEKVYGLVCGRLTGVFFFKLSQVWVILGCKWGEVCEEL